MRHPSLVPKPKIHVPNTWPHLYNDFVYNENKCNFQVRSFRCRITLALILKYWKYKSDVTKLFTLQISQRTFRKYFYFYLSDSSQHQIMFQMKVLSRSQRHVRSSTSKTLESWFRIPLEAWSPTKCP